MINFTRLRHNFLRVFSITVILLLITPVITASAIAWVPSDNMPVPIAGSGTATSTDGKLYFAGGLNLNSGVYETYDTLRVYDSVTNIWAIGTQMPTPRSGGQAVFLPDGKLYLVGGGNANAEGAYIDPAEFKDLLVYDPALSTWTHKAKLPVVIDSVAAATVNGKLYVFGGRINQSNELSDKVFEYNPDADTWTEKTSMPLSRYSHEAVTFSDGKIYIIGGAGGEPSSEPESCWNGCQLVHIYDSVDNTWTSGSDFPARLFGMQAMSVNNHIYVAGGILSGNEGGATVSSVYKYDPVQGEWTSESSMNTPRAVFAFTQTPTGLMVLGGINKPNSSTINIIASTEITSDDEIQPVVSAQPVGQPNANGWYSQNVTVNWSAIDPAPSSGTPTQPPATTATLEGINTYTSAPSCDPAGNCATGSILLRIDKTPPVTGTPTPPISIIRPGQFVTVSAPVSDTISGIDAAEYFVGTDPGLGNGGAMAISNGTATSSVHITGAPLTTKTISIRSRDIAGNWSSIQTITVLILL